MATTHEDRLRELTAENALTDAERAACLAGAEALRLVREAMALTRDACAWDCTRPYPHDGPCSPAPVAPPAEDEPQCAGPFVSAFDCPKCDPRRHQPAPPVVTHHTAYVGDTPIERDPAPPAVAGGDAPEIQVGDVVIREVTDTARRIDGLGWAYLCDGAVWVGSGDASICRIERSGVVIWRRRQEGQ